MKDVCLAATAVVTGLGNSLSTTWNRLLAAESAVAPVEHFSTARLVYKLASYNRDLWRGQYSCRVKELARLVLADLPPLPPDTWLIWSGVKSNVEYIESGLQDDIPHLPHHLRLWIARDLGLTTSGLDINAACASSTVALALGAHLISSGQRSNVLICAADIVSRFVFTGFAGLQAMSPTLCRPFDRRRDGLLLGDGAVAIWLTDRSTAQRYVDSPVTIRGWGIANDANHITGPARDAIGLITAISKALAMANLPPEEVEAFCTHGTGTPYNDSMELTAVNSLFGQRRFPLFSVKGAIGHTLGAAGGIEAALCVNALKSGIVPPTCGLEDIEREAIGRVAVSQQRFAGGNILTTNSGFGGVNAALLLSNTDVSIEMGSGS